MAVFHGNPSAGYSLRIDDGERAEHMSTRVYIATHALMGILANNALLMVVDENSTQPTRIAAATYAYAVADAMLELREAKS